MVVDNVLEQDRLLERLQSTFKTIFVDDRRIRSSHGYRAVHAIVRIDDRWVEIQVRTQEQHLWAEWSEKLSDTKDPTIKYGGGPPELQAKLKEYSELLRGVEELQRENVKTAQKLEAMLEKGVEP